MNESSSALNSTVLDLTTTIDTYSVDQTDSAGNVTEIYSFVLPWWQQLIFIVAFAVIIFIATGGNAVVIWIVLAHKRMRTVTNYFLVNLAVADFLISLFNTLFNFVFLLYNDWYFGEPYCKFMMFISVCTISASVLTFMAIAIDRYIAIMHPLRPRMQSNKILVIIVVIWAISITLAFPNFIYAKAPAIDMRTICILAWTDGFSETTDLAYSILVTIVNYAFPMVTLAVAYTRIGMELWGSKAIGEDTPVQVERIKSKRKVVKMMIVVVVIFGICWLPQHLYFLLVHIFPSIPYMAYTQQLYLVIFWLAMSNSMYNPIIYCWMNSKFREGFIRVFCWCSCRPCKNVRSRLRFRRTLFPAGVTTMSEKYSDRNGSLMTMTEYVDETSASILRSSSKHRTKKEKHSNSYSDYV